MRIAIFSDIHGNSIALDAVLEDIRAQGDVDEYWVLGDLVALGPNPVGVLERLTQLPHIHVTRGNTDRYVLTGISHNPTMEQVEQDPTLLPKFAQVVRSFAWTEGMVAGAGCIDWLAALQLEQQCILENGTRVLGVHAAPGTDDGDGVFPRQSAQALHDIVANCKADLLFVGHTHYSMYVVANKVRVVNLGSISNPLVPDLRAKYTILESNAQGYWLEQRRVDYDRRAVVEQLTRVHHPARDFIAHFLRGEQKPPWSKNLSAAEAQRSGLPMELVDENG